jgi:hypothetical protein
VIHRRKTPIAQRELAKLASVLRGNLRCFSIELEAVFRSGAVLDMTLPADWEMKTKPSALIAARVTPSQSCVELSG